MLDNGFRYRASILQIPKTLNHILFPERTLQALPLGVMYWGEEEARSVMPKAPKSLGLTLKVQPLKMVKKRVQVFSVERNVTFGVCKIWKYISAELSLNL